MMADPTLDSTGCSLLEPFALQVLGNDMEPELPDRCIVIVEPTDERRNGTYVVAEVEGVRWLRKYVKDSAGTERLIAENGIYPDIELEGLEWRVLGVVTQRNIRRKIKHYDYSPGLQAADAAGFREPTGR
jgi:SOS-response transcriptional repressor LexA